MELSDERTVEDVARGFPGALLRPISLPIHEVLETPPPWSGLQDPIHSMGRPPINKPGGRWGTGGGLKLAFADRFDLRYVESRMNPHSSGKLKTNCSWVDDLGDRKRSHKPWSQFSRFHPEWKVTGRQPNPLSGRVLRRRDAVSIGPSLVPIRRAQERRAGLQPGTTTSLYKCLDRWNPGLLLLYREEWRLVSSGALER